MSNEIGIYNELPSRILFDKNEKSKIRFISE